MEMKTSDCLQTKEKIDIKEPRKYKVLLFDDEYTSQEFVLEALVVIFGYTQDGALGKIAEIERDGKAVAGVYSKVVAQTKVEVTKANAKRHSCSHFRIEMERE